MQPQDLVTLQSALTLYTSILELNVNDVEYYKKLKSNNKQNFVSKKLVGLVTFNDASRRVLLTLD